MKNCVQTDEFELFELLSNIIIYQKVKETFNCLRILKMI